MTRLADLAQAREVVLRLFQAALNAADPRLSVRAALSWDGASLRVGEAVVMPEGGVFLIAVGKAAPAMAAGALDVLHEAVVAGVVITKDGHTTCSLPPGIRVFEAAHPIPDERGVRATTELLDSLAALDGNIVVLAMISGGGSALLEAPRRGVTLADLAETTALLLRAGAPIEALNAVRAPLSRVKAGGLRAAAPANPWITLILSDVLSNDPAVIASGPTLPTRRDAKAALGILDRFGIRESVPGAVLAALEVADFGGDSVESGADVMEIVGENESAVMAAAVEAEQMGFKTVIHWRAAEGEATELGRQWVAAMAQAPADVDVLLGGGEATVTVRGDGRGGRNTEFVVSAALELERRGLDGWALASLATDGQDALTGTAGAVADAQTMRNARLLGVDPEAALGKNDSLAVLKATGAAIQTGPTGTNVNDLYFAVRVRG